MGSHEWHTKINEGNTNVSNCGHCKDSSILAELGYLLYKSHFRLQVCKMYRVVELEHNFRRNEQILPIKTKNVDLLFQVDQKV